jgi:hypothetical protein
MLEENVNLDEDILSRIQETFPPADAPLAIDLLSASGKSGRIARCIVVCAEGNLQRLKQCLDLAARDERDIIMAGEYKGWTQRIRNLTSSFLIDAPEKMWIADVADVLKTRDFTLRSLMTDNLEPNTALAPWQTAHTERIAVFEGDLGTLQVIKESGQWSLIHNGAPIDLSAFMAQAQTTNKFAWAISSYILSKRQPANPKRSS